MAFPTGWGRKCEITIPAAKISGANTDYMAVFKTANFPTEALDGGANSALNGGGDVRFSLDSSGTTQLAVDIRRFVTGGTPDVEVVVKVPSLASGANRSVWVWYNKAGETQPTATDTYGSQAANSKASRVFSMDENPAGGAPQFQDRTSGGHHGTAYSTAGLSSVADGVDFLSNNNYVQGNIQSSPVGAIAAGAVVVDFTPRDIGKADQYLIKSRTDSGSDRIYMLIRNYQLKVRLASGSDLQVGTLINDVRTATALRWASGGGTIHKDGANFGGTYSYTGTPGSGVSNLYLGAYDNSGFTFGSIYPFDGIMYGVWLFDTDPGEDYLNTFTGMLADPAAFATAGVPGDVGGGIVLTINNASSGQMSDVVGLSHFQAILPDPAGHMLSSDQMSPRLGVTLNVAETAHPHTAGQATLFHFQSLLCVPAAHDLFDVGVLLFEPTEGLPRPDRIFSPFTRNRTIKARPFSRILRPSNNRTKRI